jgi:hypothetical protein
VARIEGVGDREAGWLTRVVFRLVRRKVGRMILPVRIVARQPKLLLAFAWFALAQERSRRLAPALKTLCRIKAAMRIGCPF